MRTATGSTPQSPSRPCFRILLLMALCALFAVAAGLAQTPQPVPAAATQADPSVAEFLATLSPGPSEAPVTEVLPPSPKLLSTICHSKADGGPGELCCYPCGIP
ncbi:MAG TPA: hypothetical protein VF173_23745, partial [Thermoanaerobaculia bacterium]|nr:hypothetical protein [Thermoanaerobaculia bacterium]